MGQGLKETIVAELGQPQIAVADLIASCFVPAASASDQGGVEIAKTVKAPADRSSLLRIKAPATWR